MRTGNRLLATLVLLASVAVASTAGAAIYDDKLILINGASEVPANGSLGTGGGVIYIDTNANTLKYNIQFSGLGAAETAAHIHGFAAAGVNAGVLHALPPGSPKVGTWNYLESQEAGILGNLTYVNIHSTAFPGGEIRGQIRPNSRPVPSVSQWGMILLALALVGSGAMFVIRRRRATA